MRQTIDLTLALAIIRARMVSQCQSAAVLKWIEEDLRVLASGTEAQRAETVQQGSVHDGPVSATSAETPKSRTHGEQ